MLVFNIVGAAMVALGLVAGFAVGGLTSLLTKDPQAPFALASLVALPIPTVLDLIYRQRAYPERRRLRYFLPLTGGMFMLLPVWVLFGAVPVIGTAVLLIRKQLGLN